MGFKEVKGKKKTTFPSLILDLKENFIAPNDLLLQQKQFYTEKQSSSI